MAHHQVNDDVGVPNCLPAMAEGGICVLTGVHPCGSSGRRSSCRRTASHAGAFYGAGRRLDFEAEMRCFQAGASSREPASRGHAPDPVLCSQGQPPRCMRGWERNPASAHLTASSLRIKLCGASQKYICPKSPITCVPINGARPGNVPLMQGSLLAPGGTQGQSRGMPAGQHAPFIPVNTGPGLSSL